MIEVAIAAMKDVIPDGSSDEQAEMQPVFY